MNALSNLRSNFRLRAFLALIFVAAFFGIAVFRAEAARSSGQEIVLQTRPIDPRDIFFGHYAILSYAINAAALNDVADEALRAQVDVRDRREKGLRLSPWSRRIKLDEVYLALAKQGHFFEPVLLTQDRQKAAAAGVVLKVSATIRGGYNCGDQTPQPDVWCRRLFAKLELPTRYYADKETALALEDRMAAQRRRERALRDFNFCRDRQAEAATNPELNIPERCDGLTQPPADDSRFGVIFSVSEKGEAVIKGVQINDERRLDSLTGARLVLERS